MRVKCKMEDNLKRKLLGVILICAIVLAIGSSSVNAAQRFGIPGSNHSTSTAKELVAAMDIPDHSVVSTSLSRASSIAQPMFDFPLDTSINNRAWHLSQPAAIGDTHNSSFNGGNCYYSLDFTDDVIEIENGQPTSPLHLAEENVPILAVAGGTVVDFKYDVLDTAKTPDTGNFIKIEHGNGLDGFTTTYEHMKYNSIPESLRIKGAIVKQGQEIGVMGTTGNSSGIHLHFEVRYKNQGFGQKAILDKVMVAGRKIIDYTVNGYYPMTDDYSDRIGTHVFNQTVSNFPINGNSFAVLSSGNAADATRPNSEGGLSTELSGLNNTQGNDLVQLSMTIKVPQGATRWAVDWKFLSEEYPEYVGTAYNDAFLIEATHNSFDNSLSTFQIVNGNEIQAPNNFALDEQGKIVSINTSGLIGMKPSYGTGTTYDGSTASLTAVGWVPENATIITIVFSIMDLGDSILDTTVFLDNFRFLNPIHILPGGTVHFYAMVPENQVQAKAHNTWVGSDVVMTLTSPSGRIIDRNTLAEDILHSLGTNWETYTIFDPEPGNWLVTLYGADLPPDGEDVTFMLLFSSTPVASGTPVAEAGSDQTVEKTSSAGAQVVLDGSASFDPDGDPLTYAWSWGDSSANGVNPTVTLPVGITTITLEISDGTLSSTDTVSVTVQDTTAPVVAIEFPTPTLTLQDSPTLIANASDLSGIASLSFYIREPDGVQGKIIGDSFENLTAILNSTTAKWEYDFNTLDLPDGHYVALAKGTDKHTNEGWSSTVPFSIRNWAVIKLLPECENNKAGRTMPIKFSLRVAESVDPTQTFIYNDDLTIKIYSTSNPNNILQTSIFDEGSKNYRIDVLGQKYITNFQTSKTPMEYTVEIWRTGKNFLVGSFNFKTVK
jgi:hypothetical protein